MKVKRFISLLLLVVYLFATGGGAYVSLACHCTAPKSHACCNHCDHDQDLAAAKADFSAPCCGNHHSTEIKLYTLCTSEDEQAPRTIVIDLPPALAALCPCPGHVPSLREKVAPRRAPLVREACVQAVGLRAPPVVA